MKPNINIGENIKKLRAEKQVTQEQLAEHLCISYQAVSKWENSVTTPDIFLLPMIAEYFEVPIDELFKVNMQGYKNKAQRLFTLFSYHHTKEAFDKADDEYEKLVAENKMDKDDFYFYGMLNQFHAQFINKKAEKMFNKAIELGDDRSDGQLLWLLASTGHNQKNIDRYEKLMKDEPDNARWWNLLASAYGGEKGDELITKGLEKFPDNEGLLCRYAGILKNQGKYDEAIEYYKKSVEKNIDMGQSWYAMADLYKQQKKYKEAIWAWEEVIALHDRLGLNAEEIEMGTVWPKQEIAKLRELLNQ